ncbi:CHAT domain-containing protein [Scytonema sp. UIC 10036]|uniref:PfkB family carbohydrate kinase n=1 Tax=Scytonema sp. UIC 10036 TaxID=2304196 RepID=UPI0012DA0A39|nr:PfkB family carbohydrate kinase [Scytonema sp. UIC 10036]MUG96987.1 CHAT domain-containing protein [Scytonema sp. UIC 10036]
MSERTVRTAVRPQDIRRAIAEEQPQIVHFCGHGLEDGSLLLEDDSGENKPVPAKGLASLFQLHADYVECVLLNACHSAKPAIAISEYINYAIGMNQPIGDKAAISFAIGFYDGLGYATPDNQDVFQRAFEEGKVAIQLEHLSEGQIPVIQTKTKDKPYKPMDESKQLDAFKRIIDIIKEQKNKKIDVITISANNYDSFLEVDRIVAEHESVVTNRHSSAGGSGANTVCGLSRLGKKTAIVGCIKDDVEGNEIKKSFQEFSVDSKLLIMEDDVSYPDLKTGKTLILVERFTGKRLIAVTPGINDHLSRILRANNEKELEKVVAQVKEAKILHLTSFTGTPERELQSSILRRIKEEKIDDIIVSFTPGAIYVAEGLNQLSEILARTHIMFLYAQQLNQLLQRAKEKNEIEEFRTNMSLEEEIPVFLDWMIKRGITHPMIIVIKDYSQKRSNNVYQNRIYVASIENTSTRHFCHLPQRFNVSNITEFSKDTTGAGDALAAGFLYGILEGEDIETCADFGFIMSREASKKFGARSNLPDQYLLRDYLSQKVIA